MSVVDALRWAERLGPVPSCIGQYRPREAVCNDGSCRWKGGCGVLASRNRILDIDVKQEIRMLGGDRAALVPVIHAMLGHVPRIHNDHVMHRMAHDRFRNAFISTMPTGRIVAPSARVASPGDLYIVEVGRGTERGKPGSWEGTAKDYDLPRHWDYRLNARGGVPLFRFIPRPLRVIEPSIQIRITAQSLIAKWPEARQACKRIWAEAHTHRSLPSDLMTMLVRVQPDRIEDVGRLCGLLLRDRAYNRMPEGAWST